MREKNWKRIQAEKQRQLFYCHSFENYIFFHAPLILKRYFQFLKIRMNFPVIILALILAVSSLKVSHHQGWESYLVNLVDQSRDSTDQPNLDRAEIISLNGGDYWTSPNAPNSLQTTPDQNQKIAQVMKSGDFSSFRTNGVVVEGVTYQFLREDGKTVFASKSGNGAITIRKTNQGVVIGHTPEGKNPKKTSKAVRVIADYLQSTGM